jgi:hypothetical protein
MVRPSVASLNSLSEVLRKAQPLYSECRSILNYLENEGGIAVQSGLQESADGIHNAPPNKDADSQPHSILEPRAHPPNRIM